MTLTMNVSKTKPKAQKANSTDPNATAFLSMGDRLAVMNLALQMEKTGDEAMIAAAQGLKAANGVFSGQVGFGLTAAHTAKLAILTEETYPEVSQAAADAHAIFVGDAGFREDQSVCAPCSMGMHINGRHTNEATFTDSGKGVLLCTCLH